MKKIKIGKYRKYLEMMYCDEFDIYPLQLIVKPNKTTANQIATSPTQTNISCKISFKPKPDQSNVMGNATNPINQQICILTSPNIAVKKGDKLVIRKLSENGQTMATYSGTTGSNPKMFEGHQEILFSIVGDA